LTTSSIDYLGSLLRLNLSVVEAGSRADYILNEECGN
ncbi:MAG: hypothetical protein ACI819_002095, partial [Neolewinella sp.]